MSNFDREWVIENLLYNIENEVFGSVSDSDLEQIGEDRERGLPTKFHVEIRTPNANILEIFSLSNPRKQDESETE